MKHKEIPPAMQMHPSGMTMARWNWPFKTPEERELVARWNEKQQRKDRKDELANTEDAPF